MSFIIISNTVFIAYIYNQVWTRHNLSQQAEAAWVTIWVSYMRQLLVSLLEMGWKSHWLVSVEEYLCYDGEVH